MKKCVFCFVISLILVLFSYGSYAAGNEAEMVEKMAEQGVPMAQYMLGMMYEHGDGVTRNLQEAIKWYEKSADGGIAMAGERLAALNAGNEDDFLRDIDWGALSRIVKSLNEPLTLTYPKLDTYYFPSTSTTKTTAKPPVDEAFVRSVTVMLLFPFFHCY